jgi:nucleotide-binding universal stress UspA family protein
VIAPITDFVTSTEGPTVDDVKARALAVAVEQVCALLVDEHGVEVRAPLVVVGAAARSIVEVATDSGVDTVVLGSHGYSG